MFLASCGEDSKLEIDSKESSAKQKKLSKETDDDLPEKDDWPVLEFGYSSDQCRVLWAVYDACSTKYTMGRHDNLDYCLQIHYAEWLEQCCLVMADDAAPKGKTLVCIHGSDLDTYEQELKRSGL